MCMCVCVCVCVCACVCVCVHVCVCVCVHECVCVCVCVCVLLADVASIIDPRQAVSTYMVTLACSTHHIAGDPVASKKTSVL